MVVSVPVIEKVADDGTIIVPPPAPSLIDVLQEWLSRIQTTAVTHISKGSVSFHSNRKVLAASAPNCGDVFIFYEDHWIFPSLSHSCQDEAINCMCWSAITDNLLLGTPQGLAVWSLSPFDGRSCDQSWMVLLKQPENSSVDLIQPVPSGRIVITACISDGRVYLWNDLSHDSVPLQQLMYSGSWVTRNIFSSLAWVSSGNYFLAGTRCVTII